MILILTNSNLSLYTINDLHGSHSFKQQSNIFTYAMQIMFPENGPCNKKTENRRLRSSNAVHEIMHLHFILIFLGIKVSSDGSLSFSNAMTLYFPVPTSPMYYRELLVGNIQRNNTAGFSLYYLNATTWEIENGVDLDCSIEQSRGHADFFSIV